jgi:hypothetical protein
VNVKPVPVAKINPAPYNPRVELLPGDREYQQIEASLDEFGLIDPLIWNEHNGVLIGGHQRFNILKAKGRKQVDCSIVNITDPAKEQALNLALNQGGRWDLSKLEAMLPPLTESGLAPITGFDAGSLDRMRDAAERVAAMDGLQPRPGEQYAGQNNQYRQDERAYKHEFSFALSDEQRQKIFDAIAHAKELWGARTQQEALSEICAFFSANATADGQ